MSTLGGYGGLERTDFKQSALWESVVVLTGQVFNNFDKYITAIVLLER